MAVNIGPKIGIDGEAQYRKELNNIIQQAKTLASEMKAVTSAFDKNDSSQAKLTAQTRVLTQQIEVQQRRVEQLQKGLDAAAKKYGETDSRTLKWKQAVNDATAELNRMQVELKQTTSETDDLGDELESAGRQVSSLGDIIKGSFVGNVLADAFSAITSELGNLGGEALDAADSLTKFESTMDFAGFDTGTISKVSSAMQDYAARTVYDLETVANTTAQLGANGVANFEQLTEAAGNLNAVAGGNADTFKSVAMVLTQTAGAGKLTTENWNQLTDAIPGASGVLQQAMLENGAYVGNFREAMEKGEITADEFNQAIMQLGFTDAAVQAAESTATIEGALGNLRANITDFITAALTEGGGMELLTTAINGISQAFTDLTANIDWAAFKETVTGAFQGISQFLGDLWNNTLSPMLDFIMANGGMIMNIISGIAAGFMAWQTVTSIINAVTAAQAALNVVMNANPIMLIISLIAGLVAAFITAYTTSEDFRNTVNAAFEAVKNVITTFVTAVVTFFTQTIPGAFNAFVAKVQEIVNAIGQFFSNLVSTVRELAGNIGQTVQDGINAAIEFITSLPGKAVQWGRDFINGLADGILDAARGLVEKVKGIADKIASFLHFSRPDTGPLREYEKWMPDFMVGLAKGIDANAWRVTDALQSVSGQMVFTPQAYAEQNAGTVTGGGSYTGSPISINVYAAEGQDENLIAELVMRKIETATQRKGAVFA